MIRRIALFCFCLALTACGARTHTDASPDGSMGAQASGTASAEHQRLWQEFTARTGQAGPFRIQANLSTVTDDGSNRATAYFWGNGDSGPLRMDIVAGPGTVVGKLREDGENLVMLIPTDNTALVASGRGSLAAFNLPVPFTLHDLSLLLTGRFPALFLGREDGSVPVPFAVSTYQGTHNFQVSGGTLPGTLELDDLARPVAWLSSNLDWRLEIAYSGDMADSSLRRAKLSHPGGQQAIIVIREIERPAAFGPDQLAMPLPPGTAVRAVSRVN